MREVQCAKLGVTAPGLERPPFPGELGQRIFENISQQAWTLWLGQQTILINEYRLSPIEPSAREMLEQQMLAFLFDDEDVVPEGLDLTP